MRWDRTVVGGGDKSRHGTRGSNRVFESVKTTGGHKSIEHRLNIFNFALLTKAQHQIQCQERENAWFVLVADPPLCPPLLT